MPGKSRRSASESQQAPAVGTPTPANDQVKSNAEVQQDIAPGMSADEDAGPAASLANDAVNIKDGFGDGLVSWAQGWTTNGSAIVNGMPVPANPFAPAWAAA